jgi:hypothetical protein
LEARGEGAWRDGRLVGGTRKRGEKKRKKREGEARTKKK